MSDDRINELEHRSIETSQSETQREKKKENIEQSIQELWGHFKRCHLCMVLEYQKEKQEQGRKKYLKLILVYVLAQLLSCVWLFATHGLQHTRFPCPSPSPGACSNSCPLRRWCHQTISSAVFPFSSCLQSFQAPGSFSVSQLFTSGDQSIGASTSASIPPMNIQDWFPLGLTVLISLQSKSNIGR